MNGPPSALEVRPLRAEDEEELLAAFQVAYGRVDAGLRPRGRDEHRWRAFANPAGTRAVLALAPGGRVLAQFAGLPQRARVGGAPAVITQAVDSFALRGGGLASKGAFARAGEEFARRYCGPGGDAFVWGFPVHEAWRIGRHALGYELLRAQPLLVAAPDALRLGPAGGVAVEEAGDFPAPVDALFERLAPRHEAIAERTAAALRWRYVARPGGGYRIGLARRAGELVGYAVLRAGALDGADYTLVCDWLAEEAARPALLDWAGAVAREPGGAPPMAVLSPRCAEWLAFQEAGFWVRPSERTLAGRSFDRRRDARWFARRWYYTLGDTDLC